MMHIFYILCVIFTRKMVLQTLNYTICEIGVDGLVMTKTVRICTYFTSFDAKCDGLNAVLLKSS